MQFISVLFQLNRRTVSKLNVAQLQLIQNDYLSQIQGLNEELVSLLVKKVGKGVLFYVLWNAPHQDDLTMEQDALMTDIEDLSQFVNTRQWKLRTFNSDNNTLNIQHLIKALNVI